jgi:hypothetical protein
VDLFSGFIFLIRDGRPKWITLVLPLKRNDLSNLTVFLIGMKIIINFFDFIIISGVSREEPNRNKNHDKIRINYFYQEKNNI